ncbi:MAG: type II toxin-antitoxin system RelE/ParE family toxin [Methanosarcinales archaeon]|jgi:mRNA interferase RelE/StbE|nr:type II toxin-antitoxin system RelE/ParE family toxin [Methanosarcinales archaeon]
MQFQIIWSESAANELKKLDRLVAKRIFKKVSKLSENPYHNVTKLVNAPYYRLRVGDYRIIFEIQNEILKILILKVGHRKSIYKD